MMNCRVQEEAVISERDFSNFGHGVGWQVILLSNKCLYSERKKFGGCAFGCRLGPGISRLWIATVDMCHLKGKQLSFHLEKRRWQSRERGS